MASRPDLHYDRRILLRGVLTARSLDALREPKFRLLFVGQAGSAVGTSLVPVALVFAVISIGGGAGAIGLVLAASRIPLAVFTLAGGVIGDRLPRHFVMLTSDVVRVVTQGITAVLLFSGSARLWELVVLQVVHATAAAFFNPAAVGLVPQTVSTPNLQGANALMNLARSTTAILGQIAAGILVAAFGPAIAFAVDAGSYVVSVVSLAVLRPGGYVKPPASSTLRHEFLAGWSAFRSHTWIAIGATHVALMNAFALAPFFVLGPLVAERWLGGAAAWAAVAAGFAAGMLAGGLISLRHRPAHPLVSGFGAILLAAPLFAMLALHTSVVLVVAAAVFAGGQSSYFTTLWTTSLQENVPGELLSRVTAFSTVSMLAIAPLALALVGPAVGLFGLRGVLFFGAGWTIVSTVAVLAIRDVRAIRRPDAPPVAMEAAA